MSREETNLYFGFELLNRLEDSNLSKKEDVLILFLHWYFVKNGFKCIGLGDTVSLFMQNFVKICKIF